MADFYVSSVLYAAVAQYANLTPYVVGNLIRQLAAPAVGNERVFRCTTAGTTGAAEPAWNLGSGANTNAGTCVFQEVTGVAAYNWAAPCARLKLAKTKAAAGDRGFAANNHAETAAGDPNLSGGGTAAQPIPFYSVNPAGSVPPVAADMLPGASVTNSSAAFNLTFAADHAYYEGFSFISALQVIMGTPISKFKDCTLKGANTNAIELIGTTTQAIEWENVKVDFTAVGQSIRMIGATLVWKNTAAPFPGTIPTTLFNFSNAARGTVLICDGVDFSAAGAGKTIFGTLGGGQIVVNARNCKFSAACALLTSAPVRGSELNLFNCEGKAELRLLYGGTKSKETVIVRTGGASDGVQTMSWKVVTNANNGRILPFECFQISIWNSVLSTPLTAVVEIENDGTVLTNAEAWAEVEYLGTAASELASVASSAPANLLAAGTNLTASSETWTTTGQASPQKQKIEVPFQAETEGWVRVLVKIARASKTIYVDPKVALV